MKMVKSLLLGSAAGLVAVAGAQAADLPVKAKPVEYVKVCSIYGAGFWYIPGTDTCIKLGGWVRAEWAFGTGNSDNPQNNGAAGRNNRIDSQDLGTRARWVISTDIRTQTEYGTLRAYARAGYQMTTGETTQGRIYTERAFIQFAGFTLGKTQSYFDFYSGAFCYGCGFEGAGSQTGAAGTMVFAYTATFGNGFTATISAEDNTYRRSGIWDSSDAANPLTLGAMPGPNVQSDSYNFGGVSEGDYAAQSVPDIVGALRVDQAWGSAQIAGALHQLRTGWYGNNTTGAGALAGTAFTAPSDAWGFAVMAGVVFNLPWNKGDQFWVEGAYSQGAATYVGYATSIGSNSQYVRFNGANVAAGWALDSVFGCATAGMTASTGLAGCTGQQLSTFWTIEAGIQHYWTPALRTSLFGSFNGNTYNATATTLLCQSPNSPIKTLAGTTPTTNLGCNPNWNTWNVGQRTIWNPVANLDIGVEIMYSKLETNYNPAFVGMAFAGGGGRAAGLYTPSSEGVWSGILRFQRNFWP